MKHVLKTNKNSFPGSVLALAFFLVLGFSILASAQSSMQEDDGALKVGDVLAGSSHRQDPCVVTALTSQEPSSLKANSNPHYFYEAQCADGSQIRHERFTAYESQGCIAASPDGFSQKLCVGDRVLNDEEGTTENEHYRETVTVVGIKKSDSDNSEVLVEMKNGQRRILRSQTLAQTEGCGKEFCVGETILFSYEKSELEKSGSFGPCGPANELNFTGGRSARLEQCPPGIIRAKIKEVFVTGDYGVERLINGHRIVVRFAPTSFMKSSGFKSKINSPSMSPKKRL